MDWPALSQKRNGVGHVQTELARMSAGPEPIRLGRCHTHLDLHVGLDLVDADLHAVDFGSVLGHVDHLNFRDGDDHVRLDGDRGHALVAEAAQRCSGLHYQHRIQLSTENSFRFVGLGSDLI